MHVTHIQLLEPAQPERVVEHEEDDYEQVEQGEGGVDPQHAGPDDREGEK